MPVNPETAVDRIHFETVCTKADDFISKAGGRTYLRELGVENFTLMERAAFVQAVATKLDFHTYILYNLAHREEFKQE
jgi:hypothetical protein